MFAYTVMGVSRWFAKVIENDAHDTHHLHVATFRAYMQIAASFVIRSMSWKEDSMGPWVPKNALEWKLEGGFGYVRDSHQTGNPGVAGFARQVTKHLLSAQASVERGVYQIIDHKDKGEQRAPTHKEMRTAFHAGVRFAMLCMPNRYSQELLADPHKSKTAQETLEKDYVTWMADQHQNWEAMSKEEIAELMKGDCDEDPSADEFGPIDFGKDGDVSSGECDGALLVEKASHAAEETSTHL